MKLLGVNIDHIATIRQLRHMGYPDLLEAASIVHAAGADSITVHLRQDRRHIQNADVIALKEKLTIPLNLEIAPAVDMVDFALQVKPTSCCLVPERAGEITTEGGLEVREQAILLEKITHQLMQAGIMVSLFVDPDPWQVKAVKKIGAAAVELRTGEYAHAEKPETVAKQLHRIQEAAKVGVELGLQVNAGHALHYANTAAIVDIAGITELNIGHAIVARAVLVGLPQAVEEMAAIVHR